MNIESGGNPLHFRIVAISLLSVGLLTTGAAVTSAADTTALDAETVAAIDQLFEPWNAADVPGVSVAVTRGEQVVFVKGYGSADLERGIPIEPGTLFDAGSIAKTFTGLAVARLVADGEILPHELDTDLRKSIDPIRQLPKKLTLRHLLYHTSGLRDWPGGIVLGGGSRDDRIDHERVLRFINAQRALNYPPGQRYSYTNSGYVLLARWIELRTGESFPTWMRQSIFEPLGMSATVIPRSPGDARPNAAVGHRKVDDEWSRMPRNSAVWGSSGIWTSAEDLGRFMVELAKGNAFKPLTFSYLTQRGKTRDGKKVDYGAGVEIGTQDGRSYLGHGGSWAGFRSRWRWFPEEKIGVCLLSNSAATDSGELATRLARIVLGDDDKSADVPASKLTDDQRARLVGRYRFHAGLDLEVFEIHDELHARATGQNSFQLDALSPSELANEQVGVRLVFEFPDDGIATGLVAHQNGEANPVPRVEIEDGPLPDVATTQELQLLAGHYPMWDSSYAELRIDGDTLVSQAIGGEAYPVRRLTRDRFYVDAYGSELRFRRDAKGRATGVTYRGLDAKRLPDVDVAALEPYEGVYRSPELSTEYRIAVAGGGLVARHPRHGTIRLTMTEENQFFGERWFFKDVTFEGRGTDRRTRFTVTMNRLEDVIFVRVAGASN